MKKGSTMFARLVLYLVVFGAFSVCAILLPEIAREESVGKPFDPVITYSFLGSAYILALPFFIALYQTHKLLTYIDKNKIFSEQSIKTLQNIKSCVLVFCILVVIAVLIGITLARTVDPREDITFMITLGFLLLSVSSVIAVFVAVLQKLLTEAVFLKSENDLIV